MCSCACLGHGFTGFCIRPRVDIPLPCLSAVKSDLAVQQIPELIFVSGVELVGPLPSDLQAITVYVAGIPASAKEPNVARALITFLRSPEAVTIIKAKGLDPG